jgi:hypothetical protein
MLVLAREISINKKEKMQQLWGIIDPTYKTVVTSGVKIAD